MLNFEEMLHLMEGDPGRGFGDMPSSEEDFEGMQNYQIQQKYQQNPPLRKNDRRLNIQLSKLRDFVFHDEYEVSHQDVYAAADILEQIVLKYKSGDPKRAISPAHKDFLRSLI